MGLKWIAVIIGLLTTVGGMVGIFRPDLIKRFAELFPRSVVPAWILTALCCLLGAKEAFEMHMGFLDNYKIYIFVLAPLVFLASVIYMKELLAPRALGGFLLLIAVPILDVTRWHESAWRLVVVVLVYLLIVYGLVLLMSPWWFRKLYKPFIENDVLFKATAYSKTGIGLLLLVLGILVY